MHRMDLQSCPVVRFSTSYGPPDIRPVAGNLSTISHPPSQVSNPEYEQDFIPCQLPQSSQAQSQNAGFHELQTPVSRENLASSEGETPISSSSGRSASPTRAGRNRQEEDERARRQTAKGRRERKVDNDDGKKLNDTRQKKADKAKDPAEKGHRSRPE
ncbi:MAG: hypothetical protein Q9175_000068 [Cornicularia normoerica]